jgi:methionyl aminopeptidase
MKVTEECLMLGLEKAVIGNRVGDISSVIQMHAESNGYSVVRDLTGHGIGRKMHEDPQVRNYGAAGTGIFLKKGMVFAIEPMINIGDFRINILDDGWTIVTRDGKPSAHYEHTVAVTETGPRILTAPEGSIKINLKKEG